MRDLFHNFYAPNEDDLATAMKTGLIAPDTNVLLNFYRYQAGTRDQLAGALEKLGDRLWMPHQVGQEFHLSRLGVMEEQEKLFDKTRAEIRSAATALQEKVREFGARIALDAEHVKKIGDSISEVKDLIEAEVTKAQGLNEVSMDGHATDKILDRIDALFENRVGEPMESGELEDARTEAERRAKERIPPGYKDRDKDDSTGDYLVWRQLIAEAKKRGLPVVFITDDTKEDWYQKHNNRRLGARRELREEMMSEAGVPLIFMTTGTFLHHAGKHLNAEVSQETVAQARKLPGLTSLQGMSQEVPRPFRIRSVRGVLHSTVFKDEISKRIEGLSDSDRHEVEIAAQQFRLRRAAVRKGNPRLSENQLNHLADVLVADGISQNAVGLVIDAEREAADRIDEVVRTAEYLRSAHSDPAGEPVEEGQSP